MNPSDIGLIGLAVMGENLVLNMESKGFSVSVYNRTTEVTEKFAAHRGAGKNILATRSIEEFVGSLAKPRKMMIMVKAGAAVDAVIDLPFALPTIVAGLVLLTLYGPKGQLGVHLAYTRAAIVLALMFVTLPFVVRAVQPVLLELDHEMEEAAASLGSGSFSTFRRIVLPNILPAILSGVALAFARAIGEIGSLVLISGNQPFKTEVSSVYIFGRIQSGDTTAATAVSVVLLSISLLVLLGIGAFRRWRTRHDR